MVQRVRKIAVGVLPLALLFGVVTIAQGPSSGASAPVTAAALGPGEGAAFAMTNRTQNNQIVTYRRAADGTLTRVGMVPTRGNGIGVDTDTQGALRLSPDNRFLYAVNPGSDDLTVFAVNGTQLSFVQKVEAGDQPLSLTIHDDLLYVLDGSVAEQGILGFRRGGDGRLTELPGSFRELSSPIAVPGQVEFSPDGRLLVVPHKTTNTLLTPADAIDVFRVAANGLATAVPRRNASFGVRPFSLAFRDNSQLVVVEAFNAAEGASAVSSYRVSRTGAFELISGSVPNQQTDACWVVITEDDQYAYVANFGSGTISSHVFSPAGETELLDGDAAFLGADSQPVDLALSAGSRYLYLLLRGTGAVAAFAIQADGSLSSLGVVTGALPVADGASGLAVY